MISPRLLALFLCLWPLSLQSEDLPKSGHSSTQAHRAAVADAGSSAVSADAPHRQNFNPERLYLLDAKDNAFLFRGNIPEQDGAFAYAALKNAIRDYLLRRGTHIRDHFTIIMVSFLNYFKDFEEIKIEQEWFDSHPEAGGLINYPLYGAPLNPLSLPEGCRNFILRHHDIDGLWALMQHLRHMINTAHPSDFVIYIHCIAGRDRTGEVSACYLMQFKGYSYKDAVALNEQVAGRRSNDLSMNAIRWYAFYLRDIEGLTWIGEID